MGFGTSFVKYVLFFFNLVFALGGLAIVGIGVAFKLHVAELTHILEGQMNVAPMLFIVLGTIIFVIAFFGCCGAVRESHCMIVTYAVMLLVIIIVQVVLAVLVFIYVPNVGGFVKELLNKAFEDAGKEEGNASRRAFSTMEEQLGCCGTYGPLSYGHVTLPDSCCTRETVVEKTLGACTPYGANQQGCTELLTTYVKKGGQTIAGVAIGLAVVEIIGAIFALCLANSIRNMDRRSHY